MSLDALNPRIAIAQVRMHWTLEENLEAIHNAMRLAAQEGAAVCAFSELAVTGFHRQIASLAKPEVIAPAIESIGNLCARLGLAVAVGTPTFGDGGAKYITHLLIDHNGLVTAAVSKRGLTDPEATFFARGTSRPLGMLKGLRCTAVICREVSDLATVTAEVVDCLHVLHVHEMVASRVRAQQFDRIGTAGHGPGST